MAKVLLVEVNAPTRWGEVAAIVGSDASIGNWDPEHSITMSCDSGSIPCKSGRTLWHAWLPPLPVCEYKFVIRTPSTGGVQWESIGNRTLEPLTSRIAAVFDVQYSIARTVAQDSLLMSQRPSQSFPVSLPPVQRVPSWTPGQYAPLLPAPRPEDARAPPPPMLLGSSLLPYEPPKTPPDSRDSSLYPSRANSRAGSHAELPRTPSKSCLISRDGGSASNSSLRVSFGKDMSAVT